MKKNYLVLILILISAMLIAGCGSSGGKDDGAAVTTPVKPTPLPATYNLTGTVVGSNGVSVPGVTIYVFKPSYTTTTDTAGYYSLNVSQAEHLVMTSKPGSMEIFKLVNLSSGNAVNQPLMVYNSAVSPTNVVAVNPSDPNKWTVIESNKINGNSAILSIPPQSSGKFTIMGQSVSNADISVEYFDLTQPLPVPLPSPATLNSQDVVIGGKQAPSVMVSVKPALLALEARAELKLPNPDKLSGKRILRFDPETHRWIDTKSTTNDLFVSVVQGGIYGIFFEEHKTSTVRGSAPAGSVIFVGDEIITVSSDGTFTATVAMPPSGFLNLLNLSQSGAVTQGKADFKDSSGQVKPDQVVSVSFTTPVQVNVSSVDLKAGTDSLVADGSSNTAILATVLASAGTDGGTSGTPIPDETVVTFKTTRGTLSATPTKTGGSGVTLDAKTVGGVATVYLIAGCSEEAGCDSVAYDKDAIGTAVITATAGGISGTVNVSILPSPKSVSLSLTKQDGSAGYSVKSDGSDFLNVVATVLNTNNAPFANIDVTFSTDGGQISAVDKTTGAAVDPRVIRTDGDGKAAIRFSASASDKTNRTVSITAKAGIKSQVKPVLITGTTVTLSNDKTNLDLEGKNKATLVIAVKDAGSNPIFDAEVTATVTRGNPGDQLAGLGKVSLLSFIDDPTKCQESGKCLTDTDGVLKAKTDVKGELRIQVTGTLSGQATVKIEALGDSKNQIYTVNSIMETFAIICPTTKPKSILTNTLLPIIVRASKQKAVKFSTSFGTWDNGKQVMDVTVSSNNNSVLCDGSSINIQGTATANLRSDKAGVANVQVFDYDPDKPDTPPSFSDGIQVAVAAPASEATQVSIQASSTVIPISTGSVTNSITLTARVKNKNDQVDKEDPVAFSLENTTGGGEYVSPVIVYTNAIGVAETKFFSGSLSSKAEGQGVIVKATALTGTASPAITNITIGGTATSIIIGPSTLIQSVQNNTAYSLDMSVQVVDSKGNPVPTAKVTLGIWPTRYAIGYWGAIQPCDPVILDRIANEDVNRNLIIDTGEDKPPITGSETDKKLTPPSSAAGSIPAFVTTDDGATIASGVGNFTLTYLKSSAIWIEAEITATTVVLGTETKSVYTFWLPYIKEEACNLPPSPYNPSTLPIGTLNVNANPKRLLANGKATSDVSALLKDSTGAPVSGAVVTFTLTGVGGFPSLNTITATTDGTGVAKTVYTSPQGTTGTATISAKAIDPSSKKEVSSATSVSITLEQGSLVMIASKKELPADGISTSTITVTALDSFGSMIQSQEPITFEQPSIGTLSASTVNTASGTANVIYTAGKTAGAVTISAKMASTGAPASTTVTLVGKTVGFITLAAAPTSINADGVSSLQITATLTDNSGTPVPAGTTVTFTTTAGKFPNGTATYESATIDATGKVVVPLISGNSAEPAVVVSCSYTGTAGTVTQNITVAFTGTGVSDADAKPGYIEAAPVTDDTGKAQCYNATGQSGACSASYTIPILYPLPQSISVRGTQGTSAAKFRFVVYDTKGKIMTKKTRVDFQLLSGPGGGEMLFTPFDYTSSTGQVETMLRTGFKSGPVIVKAYCFQDSSVNTSSSQLTISGGFPVGEAFSIAAQYLNISGLSISGLKDAISVNLSDAYGNSVPDGTPISFKTYNTGGSISPAAATTSSGSAVTSLVSGAPFPEKGFVSVTAEAINGAQTTHITSLAVVREPQRNTQILYAGTNGGGVYKSLDSGVTWTNISRSTSIAGQNRIDPYVNDIAVDSYNQNIVYAATGYLGRGNIYRSLDGGLNWNSSDPAEWGGIFQTTSAVTTLVCDDDPNADGTTAPTIWAGTAGNGLYSFVWTKDTATGAELSPKYWEKSQFTYVNDIVKVSGTHGNTAVLYAGTSVGVFKSVNGGQKWENWDGYPFVGYHITKLALHPKNSDVLYAGTKDGGIWVMNGPKTWTSVRSDGLGKGVFATYPQTRMLSDGSGKIPSSANIGNGTMSEVKVFSEAKSESWTLTYKNGNFNVVGSVSDTQSIKASVGQKCTIPNMLEFTITPDPDTPVAFMDGDTFTFDTLRDDGRHIKDLLIDGGNNKLYALTYFKSDVASHATGGVYVLDLNKMDKWKEAANNGVGLVPYEPPNDTTFFANHALASDDPSNEFPTTLYLGGEGINFYRASVASGEASSWVESKTGLTNLIMARMPVLFSGQASPRTIQGDNGFFIIAADIHGNPPVAGSKLEITPPGISGMTPTIYVYSDGYTQPTRNGYMVTDSTVVFTPTCTLITTPPYYTLPGCSGSSHTCKVGSSCEPCIPGTNCATLP